jgi:homoserine kinase
VGNQPTYDRGGVCLLMRNVLCGKPLAWETLSDAVTITAVKNGKGTYAITVKGSTEESDVSPLAQDPAENMAGRAVLAALALLESTGVAWRWDLAIDVLKGFSLKGTGLGSSGASAAAALKALEALLPQIGIDATFTASQKMQILQEADNGVPDNSIAAYFGGWVVFEGANPRALHSITVHPSFGGFVVACPRGFGILTTEARSVVPRNPPDDQDALVNAMCSVLRSGDSETYGKLMEKAHAWFVTPRTALYPQEGAVFREIRKAAKAAGSAGVTIAGAGPGIIAVVGSADVATAVGTAMYTACRGMGFDAVAYRAEVDPIGARVTFPSSRAFP